MRKISLFMFLCLCLLSCKNNRGKDDNVVENEANVEAMKMLQGIWLNEESEDIAFWVKGDTILYADSTAMPVRFSIIRDTLVLHGANTVKYRIVKQLPHLFVFQNQNNENVRLVLSTNPDDKYAFDEKKPQPLNQRQLVKRDTVCVWNGERYHCYMQVNPTSYKVVKQSYSDEGVEVENIYYDNIVHVGVFRGAQKIYSSNFYKNDFKNHVPADFLAKSVLSDIVFLSYDGSGAHFQAILAIPDSSSSFLVEIVISPEGKRTMKVME